MPKYPWSFFISVVNSAKILILKLSFILNLEYLFYASISLAKNALEVH